ncbi:Arc family DNA-binding protein [Xanthobacter sediminis]
MADIIPVMSKQPYPSQTQDRFIVRLPDGLRDRIAEAAKANGRSMNSEIVHVLESYYPAPPNPVQLISDLETTLIGLKHASGPFDWLRLQSRLEEVRDMLATNPNLVDQHRGPTKRPTTSRHITPTKPAKRA